MPVVSRESIEVRAYEIWEQEGRPHGRHVEHWTRAAEELAPPANGNSTASAAKMKAPKAAAATQPAPEVTATKAPAKRASKPRGPKAK